MIMSKSTKEGSKLHTVSTGLALHIYSSTTFLAE
uniref:Uncharacterized protein n=1 Tax=Arundo donax TaxID=35708 RepID=A0A0A9ECP3_ARUDO